MNNHVFDKVNWQSESIFFQMGNIGSEVGRASIAFTAGDVVTFEGALKRALDLFDATAEGLVKQKSPRLKEVLRAREQFTNQFFGDSPTIDNSLEQYFMQYAVADRINK